MPVESRHSVERVTLAGGVMIKNVFPGQLGDERRIDRPPSPRAACQTSGWFFPAYPLELGPQRLAGEALAAHYCEDRILAITAAQQVDLLSGPRVDAIEDRRPREGKIGITEHEAGDRHRRCGRR